MGQNVIVKCPECSREKEVWIDGRETRAGTRCGGCGEAWEFDMAEWR